MDLNILKPDSKYDLFKLVYQTIEQYGNYCDLNFIDTSLITDMSDLFKRFDRFNGNINKWDVSSVINMDFMFYGSQFNGDISGWNTSNVKNMYRMFAYSSFNSDINEWDISNVTNMRYMFIRSELEFAGRLPKWYKE